MWSRIRPTSPTFETEVAGILSRPSSSAELITNQPRPGISLARDHRSRVASRISRTRGHWRSIDGPGRSVGHAHPQHDDRRTAGLLATGPAGRGVDTIHRLVRISRRVASVVASGESTMPRTIVVTDYDPGWSAAFEAIRARVAGVLGELALLDRACRQHLGPEASPRKHPSSTWTSSSGARTISRRPSRSSPRSDTGISGISASPVERPSRGAGRSSRAPSLMSVRSAEGSCLVTSRVPRPLASPSGGRGCLRARSNAPRRAPLPERHHDAYIDAKAEFIEGILLRAVPVARRPDGATPDP